MRPSQSDVEPDRRRFDLLVALGASPYAPYGRAIYIGARPPGKVELETPSPMLTNATLWFTGATDQPFRKSAPTVEVPEEYWQRVNHALEAKPGQTNEWTIPLPDELIQAVREVLKAEKAAKDNERAARAKAIKANG